MKSIFLVGIAMLTAAATSAHADDSSCKKISALAGQAMTARQNGELLEDALDKIGDGSKFARGMILRAYKRPVAMVDTLKEDSVKEFQNEAFRECLDANG